MRDTGRRDGRSRDARGERIAGGRSRRNQRPARQRNAQHRRNQQAAKAIPHPAAPSALETHYGIQITQIGLTACRWTGRRPVQDSRRRQGAEAPRQPGQHAGADCRKQPASRTAAPRAAWRQVRRRARLFHPVPECPRRDQARRGGYGGHGRRAPRAGYGAVREGCWRDRRVPSWPSWQARGRPVPAVRWLDATTEPDGNLEDARNEPETLAALAPFGPPLRPGTSSFRAASRCGRGARPRHCGAFPSGAAQAKAPDRWVAGELLVGLRAGVGPTRAQGLFRAHGATVVSEVGQIRVVRIRVPVALIDGVERLLTRLPEVKFVEKNYIFDPVFVPDDPMYAAQWHLPADTRAAGLGPDARLIRSSDRHRGQRRGPLSSGPRAQPGGRLQHVQQQHQHLGPVWSRDRGRGCRGGVKQQRAGHRVGGGAVAASCPSVSPTPPGAPRPRRSPMVSSGPRITAPAS